MASEDTPSGANDVANVLLQRDIPTKLKCGVCQNLAINAVRIPCCGSVLCETCHGSLSDTCNVCKHSPVSAEDCKPHKSLRMTITAYLKSEARKREKEKKNALAAITTSSKAAEDAVSLKRSANEDAERAKSDLPSTDVNARATSDDLRFYSNEAGNVELVTGKVADDSAEAESAKSNKHGEIQPKDPSHSLGSNTDQNMNAIDYEAGMDWQGGFNLMTPMPNGMMGSWNNQSMMAGNWNNQNAMGSLHFHDPLSGHNLFDVDFECTIGLTHFGLPGMNNMSMAHGINPMNMNGMYGGYVTNLQGMQTMSGMNEMNMNMNMGMDNGYNAGFWGNGPQMGNGYNAGNQYVGNGYNQYHLGNQFQHQRSFSRGNFHAQNRFRGNFHQSGGFQQEDSRSTLSGPNRDPQSGEQKVNQNYSQVPSIGGSNETRSNSVAELPAVDGASEDASKIDPSPINAVDSTTAEVNHHETDQDVVVNSPVADRKATPALPNDKLKDQANDSNVDSAEQANANSDAVNMDGYHDQSDQQFAHGYGPADYSHQGFSNERPFASGNYNYVNNHMGYHQQFGNGYTFRGRGRGRFGYYGRGYRGGFGRGGFPQWQQNMYQQPFDPSAQAVTVAQPNPGVEGAPTGPRAMRERFRGRGSFQGQAGQHSQNGEPPTPMIANLSDRQEATNGRDDVEDARGRSRSRSHSHSDVSLRRSSKRNQSRSRSRSTSGRYSRRSSRDQRYHKRQRSSRGKRHGDSDRSRHSSVDSHRSHRHRSGHHSDRDKRKDRERRDRGKDAKHDDYDVQLDVEEEENGNGYMEVSMKDEEADKRSQKREHRDRERDQHGDRDKTCEKDRRRSRSRHRKRREERSPSQDERREKRERRRHESDRDRDRDREKDKERRDRDKEKYRSKDREDRDRHSERDRDRSNKYNDRQNSIVSLKEQSRTVQASDADAIDPHTLEREARNRDRLRKEQERRAMLSGTAAGSGSGVSSSANRKRKSRSDYDQLDNVKTNGEHDLDDVDERERADKKRRDRDIVKMRSRNRDYDDGPLDVAEDMEERQRRVEWERERGRWA